MCVNFAAEINWEVGKVKLKSIKKCIFITNDNAGLLLCMQLWGLCIFATSLINSIIQEHEC